MDEDDGRSKGKLVFLFCTLTRSKLESRERRLDLYPGVHAGV